MPADWRAPCLAGDLLFDDGTSSNPTLPAIGNGFLATFVVSCRQGRVDFYLSLSLSLSPPSPLTLHSIPTLQESDVVYSAGLFNGDSLGALGAVSHRAAIPAFHVTADGSSQTARALDLRQASFEVEQSLPQIVNM